MSALLSGELSSFKCTSKSSLRYTSKILRLASAQFPELFQSRRSPLLPLAPSQLVAYVAHLYYCDCRKILLVNHPGGIAMQPTLPLKHGILNLPVFLPDATFGFVRSLDNSDLEACRIPALMMNSYCLMQHPGANLIESVGGLHQFCNWHLPIVTDSGGFQTFSLIRENSKYGSISDKAVVFHPDGQKKKIVLTPEKIIQKQIAFGGDIIYCLDQCTHINDSPQIQLESVQRTIKWARRAKQEFVKLVLDKDWLEQRGLNCTPSFRVVVRWSLDEGAHLSFSKSALMASALEAGRSMRTTNCLPMLLNILPILYPRTIHGMLSG